MGKLSALPARKVIQKLQRAGFVEVRQRGSHVYLKHEDDKRIAIVPMHGSKDIPTGTLHSIVIHQAGLSIDEFDKL